MPLSHRGKFISFEGGEGSGKTTQIKLLSEFLTEQKIAHIVTREPGGTPLAERIRPLLVEPLEKTSKNAQAQSADCASLVESKKGGQQAASVMNPRSGDPCESQQAFAGPVANKEDWLPLPETLLFLAARVQHWQVKIKPALEAGNWVLCDRFTDSTLVYQGIAKSLGVEYLQALQRMVLADVRPDLTLLLDIDPKIGLERAGKRGEGEDRFEALGLEFHQKLREGFLQLAAQEPGRVKVVDAGNNPQSIKQNILESLYSFIKL